MKRLLLAGLFAVVGLLAHAQLLTWTPPFPKENDPAQNLVITADAAKGNQGLLNYTPASDVYVHIGVITNLSTSGDDWKYVKTTWPGTDALYNAPSAGTNKWNFTIYGSLRSYFGITNSSETILRIAILFRSGNGARVLRNADGSNMYVPVYTNALAVRIDQPAREPKFIPTPEPQNWTVGTNFTVNAKSNVNAALKLYHNGVQIASASNAQVITGNATVTATGNQQIVAEANDGTSIKYDTININVAGATPVAPLPADAKDGINYTSTTSATLVLRAPGKNQVFVLGDFNNWTQSNSYMMSKTPDGNFFWITLNGLTPGTEYGYQYLVDGSIKIADPYAEKILDPYNDIYISSATYPGLKPYPTGKTTGMVSVLQTTQPAYNWAVTNFSQPNQKGLVIYELLLRDFLAAHDYKTLKDTLSYLKRLGVNAIELMPVTEFEGNISWGYNTFQYFAPDKHYGPKNSLKEFIDSCHKNGIAVILDMVLNHTYGPSPLKDLYPLSNNPWYNPTAPHTAISFGDDFNHESVHTKYFFNRVLQHWMTEYKIDGYRIDFSKGLTQKPSTSDAALSAYDASRIAIINGYANTIKTIDPDAYVILEHFADNAEEKVLADGGLMLWANVWTQYQEASMGFLPNSNLDWGVHTSRNWNQPHLVTFMESHDEERVTYKNEKYGNSYGSYTIKDTATALKRKELNAAFLLTIPGPKMIWQFGELGYDYSRCYLSTNGEGGDCNTKTDPKPIRWDYQNDSRRKSVFNVYSQLNRLRFHPWYGGAFQTGAIEKSLAGAVKWIKLTTPGDTADVVVVGNFDVMPQTATVTFPTTGTWYDYLNNATYSVTTSTQSINLAPGQFFVYINRNVNNTIVTPVINVPTSGSSLEAKVFPNPLGAQFTVELYVPRSGQTSLSLFNAFGQNIGTLKQSFLAKGKHQLTMNREKKLASGNYYIKITTTHEQKILPVTIQ